MATSSLCPSHFSTQSSRYRAPERAIILHSRLERLCIECLWEIEQADFERRRELARKWGEQNFKLLRKAVDALPGARTDRIWPTLRWLGKERNLISHGVWLWTSEQRPMVVCHAKFLETDEWVGGEFYDWERFERFDKRVKLLVNPFHFIVAPIATNADNANEWALFDLQFDPARFLDASDTDLSEAVGGTTRVIRRVSINAQPGLLPLDHAPDDVRGGRQSFETYQARAKAIRDHAKFRRRISRLLAARYDDQAEPAHVEQRIYSGFASNADQTRMHAFHGQGWHDRVGIIQEIEDPRYRQIGQRLIAVEHPDLLTDAQRQHWDSWRRERFLTGDKVP
jgi:hypothetical protein